LEEDYDRRKLLKKEYPRWIFYQNVLRKRRALEEKEYNKLEILSLLEFCRDEILILIERINVEGPEQASLITLAEKKREQLRIYITKLAPILKDYGCVIEQSIQNLVVDI
jgi:hypothetical protein